MTKLPMQSREMKKRLLEKVRNPKEKIALYLG
jgi:hypothetical protein